MLDIFSENYAQRFGEGSQAPEAGVRINVIRVVAYVEHERLELVRSDKTIDELPKQRTERECYFPEIDEPLLTSVFDHDAVKEGMAVNGPAIIETPRTTYLVEPGWSLRMGRMDSAMLVKDGS